MPANSRGRAEAASGRLDAWLREKAYPLWADVGFDAASGRFAEKIAMDGTPVDLPNRGRVAPRQIYAFSVAPEFGWTGDAAGIVRKGLDRFVRYHLRPDGLSRPIAGEGGDDGPVELYDQAFALFGLAAAHPAIEGGLEHRATALRVAIRAKLGRSASGFRTDWPPRMPLWSNPHMHLLEASLAWSELSPDPAWPAMAQEFVDLARDRFIDPDSGALREFFAEDWRPAEGLAGRIVEPGHQYEWAWLLLRWAHRTGDLRLQQMALRLIDVAETHGVDPQRGVAVNELLDDFTVHSPSARLWPQTERIKAGALAANLTGQEGYWGMAADAAEALEGYLRTPVEGLWRDVLLPTGEFADEPAPASSLYHIVLALRVLREELQKSGHCGARTP
jgi:mannose/cellobiose epimerase-like protein (N-acyl-D-glucosamine 2-epimerase family)